MAVGFAARREWIAANPGKVARKKARRIVRRALRKLGSLPTAPADQLAREGLQAGAGPLLEGKAEALTAEDVLRALGDAPVDAAAIRECFRRTDGERFGARTDGDMTPPAQAALIAALRELDQRLCD